MYGYIYLIVNKINGKTYVGQRKSNKFNECYMGSGIWLKNAQRKYGIKNFEKFLIQYVYTPEEADKQEIFWTDGVHNTTAFECPGEGWRLGRVGNYHANKGSFGYKGDK